MTTLIEPPAADSREQTLATRLAAADHRSIRLAATAVLDGRTVDGLLAILDEHDREHRGRLALLHALLQMEQKIDLYHVNKALRRRPPSADELIVAFTRLIALAHQHHRAEYDHA